jgi:hypothetical protein
MSSATNALESEIGNALFLGQALQATQWSVHLFTTPPDDAGANGVEVPAGANGYAPVRHDPGADHWVKAGAQDANGRTVFSNNTPVQFPAAVSGWGQVVAFGLSDQSGALKVVAPLTTAKTINAGDVPTFLAGELQVAIG